MSERLKSGESFDENSNGENTKSPDRVLRDSIEAPEIGGQTSKERLDIYDELAVKIHDLHYKRLLADEEAESLMVFLKKSSGGKDNKATMELAQTLNRIDLYAKEELLDFTRHSEEGKVKNIEQKESRKKIKILIIEDQGYSQLILLKSLKNILGDQIDNFANGRDILIIDNYREALKFLKESDFDYQMVLLDNRVNLEPVPVEKRGKMINARIRGIESDAFQIYDDPEDYSDYPKVDAYSLADEFKKKGAIVIGTSSMSVEELKQKNLPTPDFQIKKFDSDEMLANLKEELLEKIGRKIK